MLVGSFMDFGEDPWDCYILRYKKSVDLQFLLISYDLKTMESVQIHFQGPPLLE